MQWCSGHRALDPGDHDRDPVSVVGDTDQLRRRELVGQRSENLGLPAMHHRAHAIQNSSGCLDEHDPAVSEITTSSRSGREATVDVASGHDSPSGDLFDLRSDMEGDFVPLTSNTASSHYLITAQRGWDSPTSISLIRRPRPIAVIPPQIA